MSAELRASMTWAQRLQYFDQTIFTESNWL